MRTRWQYAHPLGEKGTRDISYAPVGDPALGPVADPHRASAMELPQRAWDTIGKTQRTSRITL